MIRASKPRLATLALLVGALLVGAPREALAEEPATPKGVHQFSVYFHAGALAYLSDARTIGGAGGGIGIRDTLYDRFILQADVSYLQVLGNVMGLRLGAGVQRQGTYRPAVLLSFATLVGDDLSFLTPAHPRPLAGPAMSLGVTVAPLRFALNGTEVSVLELGLGVGSDLPGLGLTYNLGLLEVGLRF
jgi:hypothetical protein